MAQTFHATQRNFDLLGDFKTETQLALPLLDGMRTLFFSPLRLRHQRLILDASWCQTMAIELPDAT